jgi:hypothetical protein
MILLFIKAIDRLSNEKEKQQIHKIITNLISFLYPFLYIMLMIIRESSSFKIKKLGHHKFLEF